MGLLPLILSLYFPLCATSGTTGIPAPGVIDFQHFHRPEFSNLLIAPAGLGLPADGMAAVYDVPAQRLFAAFQQIAAAQPRTYALDDEPAALQAAWVVRSAGGNFPDVVDVAVVVEGPSKSSFIFYTHSLYGWYPWGVLTKRARIWLHNLNLKVTE